MRRIGPFSGRWCVLLSNLECFHWTQRVAESAQAVRSSDRLSRHATPLQARHA